MLPAIVKDTGDYPAEPIVEVRAKIHVEMQLDARVGVGW